MSKTKKPKMISHAQFLERRASMTKGLFRLASSEPHFNTDEALKTIGKHYHHTEGIPLMHKLVETRVAFHQANP